MKLLPGESTFSETGVEGLTLTTQRVRYDETTFGARRLVSITLDAVSSCSIASKSHPLLLLVALVAIAFDVLLGTLQADDKSFTYGLLLVAVVLVAVYFLSRAMALVISSPGQSITILARGVKPDALFALVDEVERAKLSYLGKVMDS